METESQNNIYKQSHTRGMVHFILSHSYTVFLLAVVLGVIFDIIIPINIFNARFYQIMGLIFIFAGSALIYWAQSTSSNTKNEMLKDKKARKFEKGPYRYSRQPTHIGLTIMTLGLAFVINSAFSIIFVIIASLITKFIYVKKEEQLLEKEYGHEYDQYKKKVNTWV